MHTTYCMPVKDMNCPYCHNTTSKVTDKRGSPEGTRRRRECLKCGKRYTTYEKVDKGDLWVIKKDGSRQLFKLEKLEAGIHRAFEKRPVSQEKVNKMIIEIEDQLRRKGKKEIRGTTIGELVMRKIKNLDNVAYIRFASVYKDFQDVKDFKEAIGGLS